VLFEVLAGGELVHADPFDEIRDGVDQGALGVGGVQLRGEAAGGAGSGVPGSEDDDAVFHGSPLRSG
jgi:hypothetical protein